MSHPTFGRASPREIEVLLACARDWREPRSSPRLAALAGQDVDWHLVIHLSYLHGITPLVYRALAESGFDGVPPAVTKGLKARFDGNAVNCLRFTAHLQVLLARLSESGIPAIPYKGPALAATAYGSLVLRMFGDLDILVPPAHLMQAIAVIRSAGFRPQLSLTAAQERTLAESDRPEGFVDESSGVAVELHTAVTPRYLGARVDHRQLWDDVETLSLGESQILSFTPEALLLVLCLHGTKHLWTRLLWVCDVAELIRARPDLDWHRLKERASEWGVERMLRLAILLAVELEVQPPENVTRWAASDLVARSLAADVRARRYRPSAPGVLAQARFQVLALGHWGDRLRYCRFVVRPGEADWESWSLPPGLRVLHYPLRALRLLIHGPGSRRQQR